MRSFALSIAVIALFCAQATCAENWPQFRGPRGDGTTPETGLPLTWSETSHMKWKTPVHGRGWSSPVIWNDEIWLTTATVDGKQLSVVCLDRESGKIKHDKVVFEIENPQFCHALNSYATPTPVIEQGRVYLHFGAHGTACLNTKTADVIWARQDLPCNHFRGPGSSPIVYAGLLIVAFDGFDLQYVVALDTKTGKTVWQRDRNIAYGTDDGDQKKAYCTATVIDVDGKPQLVYPSAGATIAYEPRTGQELWRVNHGGMNAASRPLFGHDRIYLNSADGGFKLFALRAGGRGDLTDTHVDWRAKDGVPSRSSQLLVGDLLFMVSDRGVATCLDALTGKQHWQKRLGGDFSASPLYAAGRVYYCNQEGSTFVVAAEKNFELLATNVLDDGCMASPAVYGRLLFLRTEKNVYRIEDE